MGELKVIPIYLNLICLQDCKYLKTTKLCTTSILTCFFCGDSFGAAFVNWTRWSSWYSSFLLVEWTCNKTWQGHLMTSSCHRDTDLSVGLTHGLVQGLVCVDGLLQHTDVVADLAHLTVARPASHALDVLKMVGIILTKCFLGDVESFTFSAFWWKRTDSDRTVLLSSRPAAKFFQVLSKRDATFLKKEKHSSIKSSNYSGMSSCSPDVTSSVVTSLH